MRSPSLFHLHFNTPNVTEAADRLERAGVPLSQRFGSVRGEGFSVEPDEEVPEDFRLKLQVHQRGAVNVTLSPGRRPRFDHMGVIAEPVEDALDRVAARGWSIRSNERRTFVMTPWGFRVELQPPTADAVSELSDPGELRLDDVVLRVPDPIEARKALDEVFGTVPTLVIEAGTSPLVESFILAGQRGRQSVDVATLLEGRETSV